MQNKIIFILTIIIFGVIAGGFYLLTEQKNIKQNFSENNVLSDMATTSTATTTEKITKKVEPKPEENVKENKTDEKEFIYIGKKNSGKSIDIDAVFLKQGGFVIIYENTFEPTGELLAISRYLDAGEYTKVPLHLFREVSDGEVFTAMLHADDGDKIFDLSKDIPVRNDKGEGIYTELIIKDLLPIPEFVNEEKEGGEESDE